jgi:hypothetical protein
VLGQEIPEVSYPTDLSNGYKTGPECRKNSKCLREDKVLCRSLVGLCQVFTTFEAAATANTLCYLLFYLYQQQQVRLVIALAFQSLPDRFWGVGSFSFVFRRRLLRRALCLHLWMSLPLPKKARKKPLTDFLFMV